MIHVGTILGTECGFSEQPAPFPGLRPDQAVALHSHYPILSSTCFQSRSTGTRVIPGSHSPDSYYVLLSREDLR